MRATDTTLHGLGFPESLRWREGALWFSDMFRSRIVRWVPGSDPKTILDAASGCPEVPGGLGWMPDGSLLVVDSTERRVLRVDGAQVRVHADLSPWFVHPANDLAVGPDGTAYVGGYGFDPEHDEPTPSRLVRVEPTGGAALWGPPLVFPNGCAFAGDGSLVVAETFADRVTRVSPSGTTLGSTAVPGGPDGLCIAASGAVVVACAFIGTVTNVRDGRELWRSAPITHGPGKGPTGCYDVAETGVGRFAVATASLDEGLAARVDTGAITVFSAAPAA